MLHVSRRPLIMLQCCAHDLPHTLERNDDTRAFFCFFSVFEEERRPTRRDTYSITDTTTLVRNLRTILIYG